MIEHVTTGKQKDSDKTEGSPEVSVLQDRDNVGSRDRNKCDDTENSGGDGNDFDPVDRSDNCGFRDIGRELSCQPGMHLFGGYGSVQWVRSLSVVFSLGISSPSSEVISRWLSINLRIRAYGGMEYK